MTAPERSAASAMQDVLDDVDRAVRAAESKWPRLGFARDATSMYGAYPVMFAAAFPPLDPRRVAALACAGKFLATSIVLLDHQLDRSRVDVSSAALVMLTVQALQFEFYRRLSAIVPADSPYWDALQGRLSDFTTALLAEHDFATGARPLHAYDDAVGRRILVGKTGIARAAVDALGVLSGDDGPVAPLVASIEAYSVARQMADDLVDWRTDLRERVPSMLLRRLIDRWPSADDDESLAPLGRELYYGGAAGEVLDLAIGELDRFDAVLGGIDLPAWRATGDALRRKLLEIRAETQRIVRANTERARSLPRLEVTTIGAVGIPAELASRALDYLLLQWRRGWGEARHLATFRAEDGFEVERSVQDGDVFQRATVTEALLEVEQTYDTALQPLIAAEIEHLHAMRRRDGIGGWSYFPDLPELPPDADDLAQIMLVLLRAGRVHDVEATCDPVLDVLLRDNANEDGSFETWIVPARNRSARQERQAFYTARAWGVGGDPDVVANLLYALRLCDERRFAGTIERGARFLLRRQHADGYWESAWYFGPYYGTYVATRFLAQRRDAADAVARATAFLLGAQRADGGWGDESESDSLGTALALLALLYAPPSGPRTGAAIERGLGYLARHGDAEGGWPAAPFIRLEIGRPAGKPTRIGTYASKTITTAFVAKAAALAERFSAVSVAS